MSQLINSESVSAATIDYYADSLGISSEEAEYICRPLPVFTEATHADGIKIQSLRKVNEGIAPEIQEPSSNIAEYLEIFRGLLQKKAVSTNEHTWRFPGTIGARYNRMRINSEHTLAYWIGGELTQHLVSPRIVTGRIASLIVRAVAPEEVPFKVGPAIKTDTVYEFGDPNFDQYYIVNGKLVTGGRAGSIACAMKVRNTVVPVLTRGELGAWEESKGLTSTLVVKNFPDKYVSSLLMWESARESARDIERVNRHNAYIAPNRTR